jgi:hypothetical protein
MAYLTHLGFSGELNENFGSGFVILAFEGDQMVQMNAAKSPDRPA